MLFAMSPGSAGVGEPRFDAYLPFTLAPGLSFNLKEPRETTVGATTFRLEKLEDGLYTLTARGFSSEGAATSALDGLRACLLWFSIRTRVGVRYTPLVGKVTLYDQPVPAPPKEIEPAGSLAALMRWTAVDGDYDCVDAVAVPDHKRLLRFQGGHASMIHGLNPDNFFEHLSTVPVLANLGGGTVDAKLVLAIELYAGHGFEPASNARLITLVTSLEALLPDSTVTTTAQTALEAAIAAVDGLRAKTAPNSTDRADLDRLQSRIGSLRSESIGMNMRSYAASIIAQHPSLGDPADVSLRLKKAYSCRSELLHDGISNPTAIAESLSFLSEFVPRFLEKLFGENGSPALPTSAKEVRANI